MPVDEFPPLNNSSDQSPLHIMSGSDKLMKWTQIGACARVLQKTQYDYFSQLQSTVTPMHARCSLIGQLLSLANQRAADIGLRYQIDCLSLTGIQGALLHQLVGCVPISSVICGTQCDVDALQRAVGGRLEGATVPPPPVHSVRYVGYGRRVGEGDYGVLASGLASNRPKALALAPRGYQTSCITRSFLRFPAIRPARRRARHRWASSHLSGVRRSPTPRLSICKVVRMSPGLLPCTVRLVCGGVECVRKERSPSSTRNVLTPIGN